MSSDEPDETAHKKPDDVTPLPDPQDPHVLRQDINDVQRNLGALTSRVLHLENNVSAHGGVFDDIEDLGDELTGQLSSKEAVDGEAITPRHEPGPQSAGPDVGPPAGGQDEPETDGGRSAIDIDVLCDWVHNNIAQLVERKVRGRVDAGPHWCPQWWKHPEAILRFEGLRRAWEALIPEGGIGLVTYLGYLDQTLNALTVDAGPFHAGSCKHDRHNDVTTLGDHPYPQPGVTSGSHTSMPDFDDGATADPWSHDDTTNSTGPTARGLSAD